MIKSVDNDIDKTDERGTEFAELVNESAVAEDGGQTTEPRVVNIHSKSKEYPEAELSNFYPHAFVFDGVECASMEGFLQSLKYRRASVQVEICRLVGGEAKDAGVHKRIWRLLGRVWWRGRAYRRSGEELCDLIRRAYSELYRQNEHFREALNSTRGAVLAHKIGSHDPRKTILTEEELISHLVAVRDNPDGGRV